MNGGIYVFLHQFLTEQYGILVVVTFPGHETDERVLAESHLAAAGGRAVCQHIAHFHAVALIDDRTLVHTVTLVASGELDNMVGITDTVVTFYNDLLAGGVFYHTGMVSKDTYTGVSCRLGLHSGSDNRHFRL